MACLDCVSGYVRYDKNTTGMVETVYGLPSYVSKPPSGMPAKGVIVIIPDAFGWTFPNNRLLADNYAAAGYLVYLPDFMAGVSVPVYFLNSMQRLASFSSLWDVVTTSYDLYWIARGLLPFMWHNLPRWSYPRVVAFLKQLTENLVAQDAGLQVFVAGFCWGGKHAITLTHAGEASLVTAVFTAHPSALALPGDIENIRKPISIAVGTEDEWLPPAKVDEISTILNELETSVKGMKSEVISYEGAAHGFSVRIDVQNARQIEQSEQAEMQAIKWFDKML